MNSFILGGLTTLLVLGLITYWRWRRDVDVPYEGTIVHDDLGVLLWRRRKVRDRRSKTLVVDIFLLNPSAGQRTGLQKHYDHEDGYPTFTVAWSTGLVAHSCMIDTTRWELPLGYRISSVHMLKVGL